MPRVSVLMPFHRVTAFLPIAVRSVLDQTWRDLELVLVDDGTGASLDVLGETGRDPRIRLCRHAANAGFAAAINTGVANATGDYIGWLDSDDVALPQRLQTQLAALERDPGLGLVSSRAEQIDESGRVIGREFALDGERAQHVFLAYTNPAPAPSYTGRREVFVQVPFRREFTSAADYDFFARASDGWRIRGLPEVLIQYRYHGGQTTNERWSDQVFKACLARLLTARRRQQRTEDMARLVNEVGRWMMTPPAPAESYRFSAERCLQEQFPLLAVYHARKLLSVERSTTSTGWALRVLRAAIRQERRDRLQLVRMFFTGPLRTHGLSPG